MEKLVRSRFVRLMLAAALIGLGAWAFLPYVTSRVASSAFVNAELVRVTAPIAGRLSRDLPTKGTLLDGVAKTPLIEALTPDRRHLVALEQQRAAVKAQVELATGQLAELAAADRDLAARTERHRTAVVEQIGHEIDEAKANLNACQADQRQQQQIRDRTEVLAGSGVVTRQRVDDVQAAYDGVVARCQAANAQIERFKVEAAAAAQGIFLQDGFNDTPYSEQERDRLLLRRQELEAAVQNGNSQLKELEAEIAEEQQRFDQMSHYAAILPAGHVVWNVSASPGSAVVEGQTLLDLADCRKRFVDVEVPERDFESINIGDVARIRLLGADDWLKGRVAQVRGSAARADERLLAAQVANPSPRQITVEVALPEDAAHQDDHRFCDIGRLAEVRFDRGNFDFGGSIAKSWHRLAQDLGFDTPRLVSTIENSLEAGSAELAR